MVPRLAQDTFDCYRRPAETFALIRGFHEREDFGRFLGMRPALPSIIVAWAPHASGDAMGKIKECVEDVKRIANRSQNFDEAKQCIEQLFSRAKVQHRGQRASATGAPLVRRWLKAL